MTHLRIEQNSNVEILGSSSNDIGVRIIQKLYEIANGGLDGTSKLQGTLQVFKAYRDDTEWLNQNTDLTIVVTDSYYIRFEDSVVFNYFINNGYSSDGIGLTYNDLQYNRGNNTIGTWFTGNRQITKFNELQYFKPQRMDNDCFQLCTNLTEITFPVGQTSIGGWAFNQDSLLTTVRNTSDVTDIKNSAFRNCTSLTTLDISSIARIEDKAFRECSNLNTIGSPLNIVSIGTNAFANCTNLEIDLQLPNYVGNVGAGAFVNSGIKSISNVGPNVTGFLKAGTWSDTVAGGCFQGCTKLEYADLSGSGISSLSSDIFVNCTALKTVIVSNRITEVSYSFSGCTALETFVFPVNTPPTINNQWVFNGVPTTMKVYVPDASVSAYQVADYWKDFDIQPLSNYTPQ